MNHANFTKIHLKSNGHKANEIGMRSTLFLFPNAVYMELVNLRESTFLTVEIACSYRLIVALNLWTKRLAD